MWELSTHAKKLDATLTETGRMITGRLKPTHTNSLPVLAGIAPSRAVASCTERTRQTTGEKAPTQWTSLGGASPEITENFIIKSPEPINTTAKDARLELSLWRETLEPLEVSADEHLPDGTENPWTTWKALNRLRTQVGRSRVNMIKWGFSNEQETCDCGIKQTRQHRVCPMMDTACSPKAW